MASVFLTAKTTGHQKKIRKNILHAGERSCGRGAARENLEAHQFQLDEVTTREPSGYEMQLDYQSGLGTALPENRRRGCYPSNQRALTPLSSECN